MYSYVLISTVNTNRKPLQSKTRTCSQNYGRFHRSPTHFDQKAQQIFFFLKKSFYAKNHC